MPLHSAVEYLITIHSTVLRRTDTTSIWHVDGSTKSFSSSVQERMVDLSYSIGVSNSPSPVRVVDKLALAMVIIMMRFDFDIIPEWI